MQEALEERAKEVRVTDLMREAIRADEGGHQRQSELMRVEERAKKVRVTDLMRSTIRGNQS